MFKRMIATLLAGAMFITATPIDSLQGFLQDVESVTEAEEQAADSQTEEDLVEDDTGGSGTIDEAIVDSLEDVSENPEIITEALTEEDSEAVTEDDTADNAAETEDLMCAYMVPVRTTRRPIPDGPQTGTTTDIA